MKNHVEAVKSILPSVSFSMLSEEQCMLLEAAEHCDLLGSRLEALWRELSRDFAKAADELHTTRRVSGYNDPTGSSALRDAMTNRAQLELAQRHVLGLIKIVFPGDAGKKAARAYTAALHST